MQAVELQQVRPDFRFARVDQQAMLWLALQRAQRHQHGVVLVVAHRGLALGRQQPDDLAGELLDAIKKNWVYNKPLDHENVKEELGDLMFYITALMMLEGLTMQEVLQSNADKLSERYKGLQYSDEAAQARADKQNEAG